MEDDSLRNAASDFGELFEGETAFETAFSEADVLGVDGFTAHLANLNIETPHNSSYVVTQSEQEEGSQRDPLSADGAAGSSSGMNNSSGINWPAETEEVEEQDPLEDVRSVPKDKLKLVKNVDLVVRLRMNKYLKDKGYMETLLPKVIQIESLRESIDASLAKPNSALFGPTYRAAEVYEEIERFYKFFLSVKEKNPGMSGELKAMLMPLLVFFVRESYSNGFKPISNRLISDFNRKILDEDKTPENCFISLAMSMIKNSQGFEDKYLKEVCQKRHKFLVSDSTFAELKKFLSKLNRTLLVNILSQHFLIELKSSQEMRDGVANGIEESGSPPEVDSTKSSRIRKVLNRLRGSVTANLPSIKAYTTNGLPSAAAVSRKGTTFAFGMSTAGIRICEGSSAKTVPLSSELDEEDETEEDETNSASVRTANGHEGAVFGVDFHPAAKCLFSVGQDTVMRVWDFSHEENIACKAIYSGHFGPIWSMDMSGTGQLIATASSDTTARIWVPERVDCVRILAGHHFDVDSVKFHPNETYVATGSTDKSARLWSVSDGEMVRMMTGMDGKINALAFHESGNYLVGGGLEGMVRVWDIREGELIAELPSTNDCRDLAFCGNMLAGGFKNGMVQIWNLRNIMGGDDAHLKEDFSVYTIRKPYTVPCETNYILKVFYPSLSDLYCLGSHPTPWLPPEEVDFESTEARKEPTPSPAACSIPVSTFVNVNSSQTSDLSSSSGSPIEITTPSTPPTSSSSSNPVTRRKRSIVSVKELDNYFQVQDVDTEATNNTTSSDMEFEVDEQMLESFVDDSLLQS